MAWKGRREINCGRRARRLRSERKGSSRRSRGTARQTRREAEAEAEGSAAGRGSVISKSSGVCGVRGSVCGVREADKQSRQCPLYSLPDAGVDGQRTVYRGWLAAGGQADGGGASRDDRQQVKGTLRKPWMMDWLSGEGAVGQNPAASQCSAEHRLYSCAVGSLSLFRFDIRRSARLFSLVSFGVLGSQPLFLLSLASFPSLFPFR